MRGDKTLPGSKHDRASCLACKEDSKDSEVENNNAPLLGCYLPNNFVPTQMMEDGITPDFVFPVELGEMTGSFSSRLDQTFSLLLRLLRKMMVENHPVWIHCRPLYKLLWDGLKECREDCWSDHAFRPPNLKDTSMPDVKDFVCQITEVDNQLANLKMLETGLYKPWETFKLLIGIVAKAVNNSISREVCLRQAGIIPKLPEELKSQEGSEVKFNEMWDKVLALLPHRLAPMEDLLKAACDGDLNKKCWGCYKHFHVQCVKVCDIPFSSKGKDHEIVVFGNWMTHFYFCGKCNKRKKGVERYVRLIYKAFF